MENTFFHQDGRRRKGGKGKMSEEELKTTTIARTKSFPVRYVSRNNAFEESWLWRRECEMKYLIKLKAKTFHLELFLPLHPTPSKNQLVVFWCLWKSNNVVLRRNFGRKSTRKIPFRYDETRLLVCGGNRERCQMSVEGILNENRIS